MGLSETIIERRDELVTWVKQELKSVPVLVYGENDKVLVQFHDVLICGVVVAENNLKIYNASDGWAEQTTYSCEDEEDGTKYYYVDSIDECISEVKRLVLFEAKKGSRNNGVVKVPDTFDWEDDMEGILKSLSSILSKILEGTDYSVERNKTIGERDVDIFRKGESRRVGQIWPKKRDQRFEVTIPKEVIHGEVKALLPEPKSQRANDCYYPYTDYDLMIKVFLAIANKQRG